MKALVLEEPGEFSFAKMQEQNLLPGQAKIKIKTVGICGTDIHAFHGNQPFFTYPRVLGHELGAEIVEINSIEEECTLKVGEAVCVEPYLSCGNCGTCKKGITNACENLQVMGVHVDGGMTEFLNVPISKLHVSESLPFESLALVETLSIGSHAVNRSQLTQEDKVLIIGGGPIGLGVAQFVKLRGAQACLADFADQRLQFAKEQALVSHSLWVKGKIQEGELREKFDGSLPTVIFDATGNKYSMVGTFDLVAAGGKIVLVGLFQGDLSFHDPTFHRKELTLLSSRNALPEDFKSIIHSMEKGEINIQSWLTHQTQLEGLPALMPALQNSKDLVVKAIVEMG